MICMLCMTLWRVRTQYIILYIYIIYKRNKKDNYIHNSLSSKEKFSLAWRVYKELMGCTMVYVSILFYQ